VCHPGSTVGYRINEGRRVLAYMPDHEPALGAKRFPGAVDWTSGLDLAAGADLLIHDAQYTSAEYGERVGWGHSALDHMLRFATEAGAKHAITFHHDPGHSDAMLDRLVEDARNSFDLPFELTAGTEGAIFDV